MTDHVRLPIRDIMYGPAVEFAQTWECRTNLPINTLGDIGMALHARFDEMRVGDKVTICSFNKERLSHLAEYRIVAKDRWLEAQMVGDILVFPEPGSMDVVIKDSELRIAKVNGQFEVQDGKGNTIESFVEEQQAKEYKEKVDPTPRFRIKRAFGGFVVIDRNGEKLTNPATREVCETWIVRNTPKE